MEYGKPNETVAFFANGVNLVTFGLLVSDASGFENGVSASYFVWFPKATNVLQSS